MTSKNEENAIREQISAFMKRNFPQIEQHGGDFAITDLDLESSKVSILLTGACDGCGVSPMTTTAIQSRLPAEIDEVDIVEVQTGFDEFSAVSGETDMSDVPF